MFRTPAVVSFDLRTSSQLKSIRRRTQCIICDRNAANRLSCVHESKVLDFMKQSHDEQSVQEEDDFSELVHDNNTDDENGRCQSNNSVSYTSTHPRTFFPCTSDDLAVRNLIE